MEDTLTNAEKEILVKLLGTAVKKFSGIAEKAGKNGEKHIEAGALKQKAELDVILNKIL